jgi:acyl-ACP thioesterase
MTKPVLKTRDQFKFFLDIQTRWADNDIYGHVNNVTYYSSSIQQPMHCLFKKQVLIFMKQNQLA